MQRQVRGKNGFCVNSKRNNRHEKTEKGPFEEAGFSWSRTAVMEVMPPMASDICTKHHQVSSHLLLAQKYLRQANIHLIIY